MDGLRRGSEYTISSGWIASIDTGGAATAAAATESAILPNVCSTQKSSFNFRAQVGDSDWLDWLDSLRLRSEMCKHTQMITSMKEVREGGLGETR